MRRIKLRAYDKDSNEMVTLDSYIRNGDSDLHGEATYNEKMASFLERFFGCDIMEFIGLQDRHCVDIYEGDIIKENTPLSMGVGIIMFREELGAFTLSGWMLRNPNQLYKVIGNIYQNEYLLDRNNHLLYEATKVPQ